uniref:Uncharacterized protein n=1 Tax=viral metagenome TaxID=1070528 RepID=A0A6M3Y4E6_9ZZZZ
MMRPTEYGEMSKSEKWEGMAGSTDSVPLVNDPTGRPIIIRHFTFSAPPTAGRWPSKEFIAEEHQPSIEKFLWKDELKLIDKLKVRINKEDNTFDIFAPCQPRWGSHLFEKPKTLQNILKKNK